MNVLARMLAAVLACMAAPVSAIAANASPGALGVIPVAFRTDVTVKGVLPGGAADAMGVRLGDVITHAGGKRVSDKSRLAAYVRGLKVGDPVQLTVRRKGKTLELSGTATARVPQIERLSGL